MQVKQIESQFANSNTFVVFNSNKSRAIIIDAGAEIEKVESILNGAKVLGIFLTHSHYDHISSLHKYIEKFNCNIYLHEIALERLMDENLNLSVFFGVNYNLKGVAFKSIPVNHEEIITIKNFNDEPTNLNHDQRATVPPTNTAEQLTHIQSNKNKNKPDTKPIIGLATTQPNEVINEAHELNNNAINQHQTQSLTVPLTELTTVPPTNSITNPTHETPTRPNHEQMNNSANSTADQLATHSSTNTSTNPPSRPNPSPTHDQLAPQSSTHSPQDAFAQSTHNQPNHQTNGQSNHEINGNDLQIRAIEAKGHSSCSLLYLFNDTLFSGDVLFDTGIGRYDFEENGKKEMLNSLKMLQNLKEYDKVYCGHGNASNFQKQTRNILVHINYLERH